jgi:hypothetical protein
MTFDLSSIKRSTQLPPRIVCYGVQGIGKTTFASKMPKPVFLPVEDGLGQLEVEAFPRPTSYDEVKDAIDTLIKGEHDYQTFVIDSADKLEPLIWDHVCENVPGDKGRKCDRIEEYGYQKGYVHALTEWRHILAGLDFLREEREMAICVIAHSNIVKFEAPDTDPYDRYQLRLHKHAVGAVCDWADAILFANYEVTTIVSGDSDKRRGIGKGERSLFTTERPAFMAKNRYSMDDQLPLDWPAVEKFILPPKPEEKKTKKKAAKKTAAKAS